MGVHFISFAGKTLSICYTVLNVTKSRPGVYTARIQPNIESQPLTQPNITWERTHAPFSTIINTLTEPYVPAAHPNWTAEDVPRITQIHMATHRDSPTRVHSGSGHDRHAQLKQYIKIEPESTLTLSKTSL